MKAFTSSNVKISRLRKAVNTLQRRQISEQKYIYRDIRQYRINTYKRRLNKLEKNQGRLTNN